MSRINMLLYYKVTPIVVFDGERLPIKDEVEQVMEKKLAPVVYVYSCCTLTICRLQICALDGTNAEPSKVANSVAISYEAQIFEQK
jgi:hypothetical protein